MKALVYTGTETIEFQDVAEPVPADGFSVIDIAYCGICGSDMHAYHGHDERRIPPLVLGHEVTGTALSGPKQGSRLAINPLIHCGKCVDCAANRTHLCAHREMIGMRMPGGFAERVLVPDTNLFALPDNLTFEQAALAEPLACALHAAHIGLEGIEMPANDVNVAVLGGGAIGLLAALVFRHLGVGGLAIAETNPARRDQLRADLDAAVYDPISSACPLTTVDIVLDAVGSGPTRAASSAMVRAGGVIVHIGLQDSNAGLDTRRITLQEIQFAGTYCYHPQEFKQAIGLLANGLTKDAGWIDYRPLSEGAGGFADIHHGRAPAKIILSCD